MPDTIRDGLIRTLAAYSAINHAPTIAEWMTNVECGMWNVDRVGAGSPRLPTGSETEGAETAPVREAAGRLVAEGIVTMSRGRVAFADADRAAIEKQRDDELVIPRKLRVARRVARWLVRFGSVRFVALCNTTAFGHGRDESDLDLFIVVRRGTIALTRLLAVLPFKLLGLRPGDRTERDAVCLSYFIADDALDLSSHMLPGGDPYFRYWFLSLLPLADDGVSAELWKANGGITRSHPLASPWVLSPALAVPFPRIRFPLCRPLEGFAWRMQDRAFPSSIRERMNRDTRVIVTEQALKFHVEDRREEYRKKYEEICRSQGIEI